MKWIRITNARQNNLQSVDLQIPLHSFTVVCGLSGSGKSSLAFETLFAEGHRHYTQTLSHYVRQSIRQMPKPLVDKIDNIPPSLAYRQKNNIRSSRPIVATFTELADCLRLLFTYLHEITCPQHKKVLQKSSPSQGAKKILKTFKNQKGWIGVSLNKNSGLFLNRKQLLQHGFHFILEENLKRKKPNFRIKDISKTNYKMGEWKANTYLVLDSLVFNDESRLADSLKLAERLISLHSSNYLLPIRVINSNGQSLYLSKKAICPKCAYVFPLVIQSALFNFNNSLGACSSCKGFGSHLLLDENKIVREPWKSLAQGAIEPLSMPSAHSQMRNLRKFCISQKINWHTPWEKLSASHKKKIWNGQHNPRSLFRGEGSFFGIQGFFDRLERKKYRLPVRVFLNRYKSPKTCSSCGGSRFRKEVSYIKFQGKTLPDFLKMDIVSLKDFFKDLVLTPGEKRKIPEVVRKINFLLSTLTDMGLGYLELNREIRSLSSGELQRLSLVHQLGLGLSYMLYVLDEPTVGLHPRDTNRLIHLLQQLKKRGNTLVVVEHDPEVIKNSSFVVEMGPGSGQFGGQVVFSGATKDFLNSQNSLTNSYLKNPLSEEKKLQNPAVKKWHGFRRRPVSNPDYKYFLEIIGCRAYNLKNIHLKVPLNRLVCVTGVSGSGKSTLVVQSLYPALARSFGKKTTLGQPYSQIKGLHYLKDVVLVECGRAEKNQRSLPVTYLKIYDFIRQLMAEHGQAEVFTSSVRSFSPRDFSLNVDGGRCPNCRGLGYLEVEMMFMDPMQIVCEECQAKRFKPDILKIKWRGKNIYDILSMTVQTAMDFFVSYPQIWKPLNLLKKVGMDYVILGQSLSTLSSGESQRLKLARELMDDRKTSTLYILDEPTLGLHFREVHLLLEVLCHLVDRGNSVLLIEHNLEIVRHSDYLIDMGPGAGKNGGEILFQGPPQHLAHFQKGPTSHYLKAFFPPDLTKP